MTIFKSLANFFSKYMNDDVAPLLLTGEGLRKEVKKAPRDSPKHVAVQLL